MWGVGGGFELRNKQKKKTIIPVVLLCSFHCLGKVKKKLTTGKASCVSILPCFFFITFATHRCIQNMLLCNVKH